MRGPYGNWGKHIELFELYKQWARDPRIQESEALLEGTGAPEGRADFPIFMLTVIRHRMRQGFIRKAAQWEQYLGVERAEDFRVNTVSQLNGLTGMGPVAEFDEYPRIRSSEEMGPSYSVGKHGGVYSVTYEMVQNDEANVILNRTPTELGRMSAAYVAQVAAALVEANGNWIDGNPFFSTTAREGLPTGNIFTGAAAEPTEDNLVTMVEQMRTTTDAEGFPIDIEPGNILTRSERVRLNFKRIERSQETAAVQTVTSGTAIEKGTANPLYQDDILPGQVLVDPYLSDPNDYILFAQVNRPAFIIAFLRDQREPFIGMMRSQIEGVGGGADDPYSLDFDELPFKVRHVFGAAQGDPRAARLASRT